MKGNGITTIIINITNISLLINPHLFIVIIFSSFLLLFTNSVKRISWKQVG